MVKFLYTICIVLTIQTTILYLTHYLALNIGSTLALVIVLILEGIFIFNVIWYTQYTLNNK